MARLDAWRFYTPTNGEAGLKRGASVSTGDALRQDVPLKAIARDQFRIAA
jgi:hypothetical protein